MRVIKQIKCINHVELLVADGGDIVDNWLVSKLLLTLLVELQDLHPLFVFN